VNARVNELTPLFSAGKSIGGFHPEVKKVVLQQLCDKAGIRTIFETLVCGVAPATENSLWKLELAAAESLHALGTNRRDLVEKYLNDPRGYVRRCTRWLADKLARGKREHVN